MEAPFFLERIAKFQKNAKKKRFPDYQKSAATKKNLFLDKKNTIPDKQNLFNNDTFRTYGYEISFA